MMSFVRKLIPDFLISRYHFWLVALGTLRYGFPSRDLVVIGITGTNGKSTTVDMCHRIFREARIHVASISSIRFKINDHEWQNTLKMTMPGRFQLQKFLRDAVDAGCTHAVIEVTSEGIKQWRHWGIDFDVAVMTNLTKEHIESHGSFEKYRKAKTKLFESLANSKSKIRPIRLSLRVAPSNVEGRNPKQIPNSKFEILNKKVSIINLDDDNAEYFLQFPADEIYGYTIENAKGKSKKAKIETSKNLTRKLEAKSYKLLPDGVEFVVDNTTFRLKLHGEFNIFNALAAICVGLSQGIDLETIKKALEEIESMPGRFEIVIKEPFTVIVDYAHTPDALEKVYQTAINLEPKKLEARKLICVLGAAGGGRDKWKRPELGKLAAKYCDQIILANEDPYDENPASILREIEAGFSKAQSSKHKIQNYEKILDRREAIRKALSVARENDTVIITGKGCEPWMMVAKGKKIPWDDRKVAREESKKLTSQK